MKSLFLLSAGAALVFAQPTVESAWQTLDAAMKDGNPAKRIAAVVAMSVVKPQAKPVALIEGMLEDGDLGVRQAACNTLGDIRSRASIPQLRKMLDDKAPEVIFASAKALYLMGDPAGREVLSEVLLGEQKGASGFVSTSIRGAKLKLHDPKALLLIGVNQAAAFLGPAGAGVPVAEELLKDGQASGKTVAALLLATDTTAESRAAVRAALSDKNWTVRAAALRAIALRDLTELYADAALLLDDKRDEVKDSAAAAMIRLRQGPARRALPATKTAPGQ
ncbi:MAG: HEAT repeat domain-containing protein [Acidobacteriota bacterium]